MKKPGEVCQTHILEKLLSLHSEFKTFWVLVAVLLYFFLRFFLQLVKGAEKKAIKYLREDCCSAGWAAARIYIGTRNFIGKVPLFSPMHVEESSIVEKKKTSPPLLPASSSTAVPGNASVHDVSGNVGTQCALLIGYERRRGRSQGGSHCWINQWRERG